MNLATYVEQYDLNSEEARLLEGLVALHNKEAEHLERFQQTSNPGEMIAWGQSQEEMRELLGELSGPVLAAFTQFLQDELD